MFILLICFILLFFNLKSEYYLVFIQHSKVPNEYSVFETNFH